MQKLTIKIILIRSIHWLLLLLIINSVSGCASSIYRTDVDPSVLTKPVTPSSVKLTSKYQYEVSNWKLIYSIEPGVYLAELKGNGGTYYRGPKYAVKQSRTSEKDEDAHLLQGGIFVSDKEPRFAKIYQYKVTEAPTVGAVQAQISAAQSNPLIASPANIGQALGQGIGTGVGVAVGNLLLQTHDGWINYTFLHPDNQDLLSLIEFQ